MSAMSSKHVMAGTIVNTVSAQHALLHFRLNSEMHWTNRKVAHHLHDNGPFHYNTDTSSQKYYYIWIESFAIGSFFILKYRLTLKKFILFILHLVQ